MRHRGNEPGCQHHARNDARSHEAHDLYRRKLFDKFGIDLNGEAQASLSLSRHRKNCRSPWTGAQQKEAQVASVYGLAPVYAHTLWGMRFHASRNVKITNRRAQSRLRVCAPLFFPPSSNESDRVIHPSRLMISPGRVPHISTFRCGFTRCWDRLRLTLSPAGPSSNPFRSDQQSTPVRSSSSQASSA